MKRQITTDDIVTCRMVRSVAHLVQGNESGSLADIPRNSEKKLSRCRSFRHKLHTDSTVRPYERKTSLWLVFRHYMSHLL